jgi:periplasmic protein TonB
MSTPNPNDHDYNRVDPDAPVVVPPRSGNSLLWLLVLVALIALGLWWYGKRQASEAVDTPASTEQPAVTDATTPTPAVVAEKKPVVKKSAPTPRPVAKTSRDPSPIAGNQPPRYPPQALRSGVEGSVSVRVEVDPNGVPTDVTVVERSGERSRDLDRAVTDAVRKWRFEPAMKDGKAVAGAVVVPVDFKSQ